ncbi:Galactose oxidase, central domain [Chryseolinea serpens]|uniref:Galactose oxidase, central domain n=1 Tax=Chryseolinea serpens TaxID=947013 RepID=A0A1M5K358_9BACT|nr:kelch repeat-containing protein [Chryseolinea serpens]SHG47181.1 Galactose oxidase, central domain [Chryseolinea serpens]
MLKFTRQLSFLVVLFGFLFGFTACQDEGEKEIVTGKGAIKVVLVSSTAQIGTTPFDVTILNAKNQVLYTFTGVTTADSDKSYALEPGEYKVSIRSKRSEVLQITDHLFSGTSDFFVITSAQTIDIPVPTHAEPFEQWVRVADAPFSPRYGSTSFIIDSTIYVGLGANFLNERFQDWWSYSIATNTWTQLRNFPGAKRFATLGFSANDKGYVCLGYAEDNSNLIELWEYNPVDDSWERLADFPGDGRSSATAFVLDDKIHVGSGIRNGYISLLDFYAYDRIQNKWSGIVDFPGDSTYGFTSLTINNTSHLLAGVVDNDVRTKQHFIYNAATGWAQQPDFPGEARLEGVAFGINGIAYFGLGSIDNNTPGRDFWKFDPENSAWTQVDDFVGQRRFIMMSGSNGYIGYAGLGYYGNTMYNDLYLYFPAVEKN